MYPKKIDESSEENEDRSVIWCSIYCLCTVYKYIYAFKDFFKSLSLYVASCLVFLLR